MAIRCEFKLSIISMTVKIMPANITNTVTESSAEVAEIL